MILFLQKLSEILIMLILVLGLCTTVAVIVAIGLTVIEMIKDNIEGLKNGKK